MSDDHKQDEAEPTPASTGSTGHTPGPWVVGDTYAIGRGLTIHQHGHWVSLAEVRRVGPPTQLDLANARLIAAAPELLAALKRQQANIRRWLETGVPADAEESKSISEQIDEAIKLAEDGR